MRSTATLWNILLNRSSLVDLIASCCSLQSTTYQTKKAFAACKGLRRLHLSSNSLFALGMKQLFEENVFLDLEDLNISSHLCPHYKNSYTSQTQDEKFIPRRLFASCPNLKTLYSTGCYSIFSDFGKCTRLAFLNVQFYCGLLPSPADYLLMAACRSPLRQLSIDVNDSYLLPIIHWIHSPFCEITYLRVNQCGKNQLPHEVIQLYTEQSEILKVICYLK